MDEEYTRTLAKQEPDRQDKDIVAYVAGSVIAKLSHKYTADFDHLTILSTLKCNRFAENARIHDHYEGPGRAVHHHRRVFHFF